MRGRRPTRGQRISTIVLPFKKARKGILNDTDRGLKEYAEHIKKMIANSNNYQNKLLEILTKIFRNEIDPITKKTVITIHEIDYDKLNEVVTETRNYIVEMYIQCEKDFLHGIHIFELIVEIVQKETTQYQKSSLESLKEVTSTSEKEHVDKYIKDTEELEKKYFDYIEQYSKIKENTELSDDIKEAKLRESKNKFFDNIKKQYDRFILATDTIHYYTNIATKDKARVTTLQTFRIKIK